MAHNSSAVVRRVLHLDLDEDGDDAAAEEATSATQEELILAAEHGEGGTGIQLHEDRNDLHDKNRVSALVVRVDGDAQDESANKESSLDIVVRGGGGDIEDKVHMDRKGSHSIMRMSIGDMGSAGETETVDETKKRIMDRRGAFKWLPVYFQSDLEHGAWWFTAGSFITVLIPMFPLISLWQGFWPDSEKANGSKLLPDGAHATAYALLMLAGILYTAASWLFVRAFKDPIPPPLFDWHRLITSSDELLAVWLFLLGTLPAIPVMLIYVIYNPYSAEFIFAYIICLFANAVMCVVVYSCMPDDEFSNGETLINVLSPYFQNMFSKDSSVQVHIQNDWLLSNWMMLFFCTLSVIMSFGQLIYYCGLHYRRGIYDYSTGFVDCLMFMIGTMYIIAG